MCALNPNGAGCPQAVRRSELERLRATVEAQAKEIERLRAEAAARDVRPRTNPGCVVAIEEIFSSDGVVAARLLRVDDHPEDTLRGNGTIDVRFERIEGIRA